MDASSPDADRREVADVLLARARSDLRACRVLADDHDMGDDVVGFHAQQAVEKALKVGLTLAGIAFPRTHDLDFLIARARDARVVLPPSFEDADWLTPWAAQLRYDEAPAPLDRAGALAAAATAVSWAEALLQRDDAR